LCYCSSALTAITAHYLHSTATAGDCAAAQHCTKVFQPFSTAYTLLLLLLISMLMFTPQLLLLLLLYKQVKHDDSTSDDATTSDIPAPPKRRPLTLSTQDPNVLTNILYKRGQPTTAAEKLVALATAVSAVPQPSDQAPLRVNSWKIREVTTAIREHNLTDFLL
jgi:hypothetical protein